MLWGLESYVWVKKGFQDVSWRGRTRRFVQRWGRRRDSRLATAAVFHEETPQGVDWRIQTLSADMANERESESLSDVSTRVKYKEHVVVFFGFKFAHFCWIVDENSERCSCLVFEHWSGPAWRCENLTVCKDGVLDRLVKYHIVRKFDFSFCVRFVSTFPAEKCFSQPLETSATFIRNLWTFLYIKVQLIQYDARTLIN